MASWFEAKTIVREEGAIPALALALALALGLAVAVSGGAQPWWP